MRDLFIAFLFFISGNIIIAQQYAWQKLNTEQYKGKQDDIYFINKNCRWYINGYGKIFHTMDGGESWEMH